MRLPQDRILHIGTELKDGKLNIVAEWQGELVRCKDCIHHVKDNGFTMCSHDDGLCGDANDNDFCSYGERREP